jgi:hypothetical protein
MFIIYLFISHFILTYFFVCLEFISLEEVNMLPALRSRTSLTRVINQLLSARRQQDAFRVPTQNSSAVSVLNDEQRAHNLKIWPGK